jgi:hypothetical protein
MALDSSTILSRSDSAFATEVDGEVVLIGIATGQYFGLDAIGSAIWRQLDQPRRIGDIFAQLQSDFEGDPAAIEHDTLAFLEKLVARQLVNAA